MAKIKKLYEGKAKEIYSTKVENEIVILYKDDATANNGEKHANISEKGILNNKISEIIYNLLTEQNIKHHFIKRLNDREQLCKKVEIIPLEVIGRNYIAGSMARKMGMEEGKKLSERIIELSYKDDSLGDPMINDYYAVALNICTWDEIKIIYNYLDKINNVLIKLFDKINMDLIDFKLEFGRDENNNIILADEISPDTCRLWDKDTREKFDKDIFRKDIGDLRETYSTLLERLENV